MRRCTNDEAAKHPMAKSFPSLIHYYFYYMLRGETFTSSLKIIPLNPCSNWIVSQLLQTIFRLLRHTKKIDVFSIFPCEHDWNWHIQIPKEACCAVQGLWWCFGDFSVWKKLRLCCTPCVLAIAPPDSYMYVFPLTNTEGKKLQS